MLPFFLALFSECCFQFFVNVHVVLGEFSLCYMYCVLHVGAILFWRCVPVLCFLFLH